VHARVPGICLCEDKKRLRDEYLYRLREITALLSQQAEATVCDLSLSRFELLLHLAREKKDAAKYALIAHIESHRCEDG
jgi:hypothetical protein